MNISERVPAPVSCTLGCECDPIAAFICVKSGQKACDDIHDEAPRILGIPMTQATLITAIGYTITMSITLSGLIG